jgi:hypothetical protein
VAALGTLLNVVPYALVHLIAQPFEDEPNQIATYKLFPSLLLYPAAWIGSGLLAARWLGPGAGLAVGIAAPFAGWVALRWHERRRRLWRESRAFFVLRNRRDLTQELRRRRQRLDAAIAELVVLARQPASEPPPRPAAKASRRS